MAESLFPFGLEDEDQVMPSDVSESRLAGAFEGAGGRTRLRLINGQIWEQRSPGYFYRYTYMPKVMVFRTEGGYAMRIQGVPGTIPVRRAG